MAVFDILLIVLAVGMFLMWRSESHQAENRRKELNTAVAELRNIYTTLCQFDAWGQNSNVENIQHLIKQIELRDKSIAEFTKRVAKKDDDLDRWNAWAGSMPKDT